MKRSNILVWVTLILIILKILGVINISWLWVTFLCWAPLAILAVLIIPVYLVVLYCVVKYLIFQHGK